MNIHYVHVLQVSAIAGIADT